MLNDLSAFTRWSLFLQMLGPGVALGGIFAAGGEELGVMMALLVAGVVLMLGWAIGSVVMTRRLDRRVLEETVRGSDEIVDRAVEPVPALGRVVRRRIKSRAPAYSAGAPRLPGPAVMAVLEAVGDGPPRRVAALVPAAVGLHLRGQYADLWLHPHRREVAVLETVPAPGRLQQVAADPRWSQRRAISDRAVAGGYAMALVAGLGGLLAGIGAAILVTLVL